MDRYTPPFLGRRRGWLLISQLLLVAAIVAMGFMQPAQHLWWLAALAVLVAFCSASQDIVFDAYKTDLLKAEERGAGAAISVLGYRLAMLVSGGGAVAGGSLFRLAGHLLADGRVDADRRGRHADGAGAG